MLPWHFRTDLRDNVRVLRKQQDGSALVYMESGGDVQVRAENEKVLAFDRAAWHFGGAAGSVDATAPRISKLVAPLDGLYAVWFVLEWNNDNAASGVRMVGLRLNGADSDMPLWTCEPSDGVTERTDQNGYYLLLLKAGDELELFAIHTSATSEVSVNSGEEHTRFGLDFLGETNEGATGPYTWTAPRTWAAGDQPTATSFNTDIRDNLLNLRNCRGVAAIVRLTLDESITPGTATAIPWDEAILNMGTVWSALSPTRLTVLVTGWYAAAGFFHWEGDNAGQRRHDVRVNGTTTYRLHTSARLSDGTRGAAVSAYGELPLTAGDYIEWVLNSGSTDPDILYMTPTYGSLMLLGD